MIQKIIRQILSLALVLLVLQPAHARSSAGELLLFDASSMDELDRPSEGLVKLVLFRDLPTSSRSDPVYVYVNGRLLSALMPGGYNEVAVCPGTSHLLLSMEPLTDRELVDKDISEALGGGAKHWLYTLTTVAATPIVYFSIVEAQEGGVVQAAHVGGAPSPAQRRKLHRQLHTIQRTEVKQISDCSQ